MPQDEKKPEKEIPRRSLLLTRSNQIKRKKNWTVDGILGQTPQSIGGHQLVIGGQHGTLSQYVIQEVAWSTIRRG